jgi:predicted nuclease of restriction endonuclease-like (RecB) superfamily
LIERVGLSEKRDEILELARQGTVPNTPEAQLRDPYIFEFLGIEERVAMTEGSLGLDALNLGRKSAFVPATRPVSIGSDTAADSADFTERVE